MLYYFIMRSNTKKNQIYEIHLRKVPVTMQKTVLPHMRSNIQNVVSYSNASPAIIEPVLDTVVDTVLDTVVDTVLDTVVECVENDRNNLQYVKSKIMSKYGNLYKSV